MATLEQTLTSLGLTPTEVTCYLALAEAGKSSANHVATRVALPRSTVYSALESLAAKGLIAAESTESGKYFAANTPDAIVEWVRDEREQALRSFMHRENSAADLIPKLEPFFKQKNYSVPTLKFIEGAKNLRSMLFSEIDTWRKSIAKYDKVWWGYQDNEFIELHRDWLDEISRTQPDDERVYLLTNASPTELALQGRIPGRELKLMPAEPIFSSTIWVLGDYVVMIMVRTKPYYSYQIRDPILAANLRTVFQLLWRSISTA